MLRRGIGLLPAILALLLAGSSTHSAAAGSLLRVVVSFSILQDIARQIGGEDAEIVSLVGANSDAHAFEPSPDQARLLAAARLFIVNGLGFESWLTRLTRSAQYGGPVIAASDGIAPRVKPEPGNAEPLPDPHAWQDVRNVMLYADKIARALAAPTRLMPRPTANGSAATSASSKRSTGMCATSRRRSRSEAAGDHDP